MRNVRNARIAVILSMVGFSALAKATPLPNAEGNGNGYCYATLQSAIRGDDEVFKAQPPVCTFVPPHTCKEGTEPTLMREEDGSPADHCTCSCLPPLPPLTLMEQGAEVVGIIAEPVVPVVNGTAWVSLLTSQLF